MASTIPSPSGAAGCLPGSPEDLGAEGTVFETTDLAYAAHILSGSYGRLKIDGHGRHGVVRLSQAALGPSVRLDHNSLPMSFDATGTRSDVLLIGHLRSGQVAYRSGGTERAYGSGDVYLAVQPGHPYKARSAGTDIELAVIDPDLPGRLADGAPAGTGGGRVQFTGSDPLSPQAARQWRATYAYVRHMVLTRPEAERQSLVASSAARLLVATALAAFPNSALTDPTVADRHDASPPTLRRAMAFIDENASRDITVADIAAAAHVTIRAVQLAFRRHMDTTPMGYLRQIRLAHARHDLITAGPAAQTVTAIAYRWGFPSSSRFAAHYQHAYGISPSHTLRQD